MTYSFGDWKSKAPEKHRYLFATDKINNFRYLREHGLSTKPIMEINGNDMESVKAELKAFCTSYGPIVVRTIPIESGASGRKFLLDATFEQATEFIYGISNIGKYAVIVEAYQKGEFSGNIVARRDGSVLIESVRGNHPNVAYGKIKRCILPDDVCNGEIDDASVSYVSRIDVSGGIKHPSCLTGKERRIIQDALEKIRTIREEYQPGYYEWVYDKKWGLQFIDAIRDEGYTR